MPAPVHIQKETIDKFLTAWKDGTPQDTVALWADDFEQQLLPFSLQQPPRPRAHAEFFYPKLVNNLRNWKVSEMTIAVCRLVNMELSLWPAGYKTHRS